MAHFTLEPPKVTAADIEAEIVSEFYFSAAEGMAGAVDAMSSNSEATVLVGKDVTPLKMLTFCVLVLRNGHKVVGINHGSVSPDRFDAQFGRDDARRQATEQIWPLLGFRLRDQLARQ